jgi:hypothetical protein
MTTNSSFSYDRRWDTTDLHIQLTPEQLDDIAHGKVVNLAPKDKSDCPGTQISEESAGSIAGGLFEDPAGEPWDFSREGGNNNPFSKFNVGITIGLGPVSVGFDVGSCKP